MMPSCETGAVLIGIPALQVEATLHQCPGQCLARSTCTSGRAGAKYFFVQIHSYLRVIAILRVFALIDRKCANAGFVRTHCDDEFRPILNQFSQHSDFRRDLFDLAKLTSSSRYLFDFLTFALLGYLPIRHCGWREFRLSRRCTSDLMQRTQFTAVIRLSAIYCRPDRCPKGN